MAAERISVAGETLVVHRFGSPGARPKVYLQGALHADEVSATVALTELVRLLQEADAAGRICGEVVVVPHCNPLGMKQFVLARHLGRFSLDGRNFNRAFPQVGGQVVAQLEQLSPERQTIAQALCIGATILDGLMQTGAPVERLQAALMGLAWGADMIVDVHADMEAMLHLYTSQKSWPVFEQLARTLNLPVVILADKSADSPFDEVHGEAWDIINAHLDQTIGQSAFRPAACTLELRGLSDVTPEWAASDSAALRDFLVRVGAITGTSQSPAGDIALVTTLDAVEVITSTMTGVVVHLKSLGSNVSAGDRVAMLHDPFEPDEGQSWRDVIAGADGVIFARWHQRVVHAGMAVIKIAGVSERSGQRARLLD